MSRSKKFHLCGDDTTVDERLQNLGLWAGGRSLSCYTCCNTGPRFFRSHPKDCLLWHTRGCGGSILKRILTGLYQGWEPSLIWWAYQVIYQFALRIIKCLFVCFESHEQFFSYLATVTIAGDRAANLDLYLALTAFGSKVHRTFVYKVISERPVILTSECCALGKGATTTILNVLGLTRPARAGLELTTSHMLSESTTTGLPQILWFMVN
jgi:hypothetical protein